MNISSVLSQKEIEAIILESGFSIDSSKQHVIVIDGDKNIQLTYGINELIKRLEKRIIYNTSIAAKQALKTSGIKDVTFDPITLKELILKINGKRHICLGYGTGTKCDTCDNYKHWLNIDLLDEEERKKNLSNSLRIEEDLCVLNGRPYFKLNQIW